MPPYIALNKFNFFLFFDKSIMVETSINGDLKKLHFIVSLIRLNF